LTYQVFLAADAEKDILEIYDYISLNDSKDRAVQIYRNFRETIFSLKSFPGKGHYPPELERLGIREYREIHSGVYRIIYQISGERVYVHTVLDGRRDLQDLLEHRLIR
jgi:toxin ParE1/3/4